MLERPTLALQMAVSVAITEPLVKPGESLFELSMLGGAVERRYRRLRPEVELMPWDSLDLKKFSAGAILKARSLWTEAAFQEFRTGAACAATLQALIVARAPVDLIAMASRFPLDEMVHVELCARLVQALGGGAPISYDPKQLIQLPNSSLSPIMQATELVVRNFCVGEALSIPVLRNSWHATRQPLIKAILGRIVKDEAAHGAFGFMFLDWADDQLSADDRTHLSREAALTIDVLINRWHAIDPHEQDSEADRLGWMENRTYVDGAKRALQDAVIEPLAEFGITPMDFVTVNLPA